MPYAYLSLVKNKETGTIYTSPMFQHLDDLLTFIEGVWVKIPSGALVMENLAKIRHRQQQGEEITHEIIHDNPAEITWIERSEIFLTYQAWYESQKDKE